MKNLIVISGIIFFAACKNEPPANQPPATDTASVVTDTQATVKLFFPVYDFLLGEIRAVDSLPIAIKKFTTTKAGTDSVYIKLDEFHELANEFLVDELKKENFESTFKESSFQDQSTGYSVFSYSPNDQHSQINRVDVATEAGSAYDKVNSIFIIKNITRADTLIAKKLYWKAENNFIINTELRAGQKPPVSKQVKVVWNY